MFVSLISMCLGMFLLGFILYGILCVSWTWLTISFSMLGKFSTIISSKIFSYPFFLSSSESEVTQLCPTPSNPMDCSPAGPSVHGIFQARVLEWAAIAFSDQVFIIALFFSKRALPNFHISNPWSLEICTCLEGDRLPENPMEPYLHSPSPVTLGHFWCLCRASWLPS